MPEPSFVLMWCVLEGCALGSFPESYETIGHVLSTALTLAESQLLPVHFSAAWV